MINFYKGSINRYDSGEHGRGIYFATDTKEIMTGSESYGKNADKSLITEDIVIADGPLANDITDNWPSTWVKDGNKVIPNGTSVEDAFKKLFFKTIDGTVTWGKVTWNPSLGKPTVTLSSDGPVEVGSTVTCTVTPNSEIVNTRSCTCTTSQGYFDTTDGTWQQGDKTVSHEGNTSGTLAVTYSWNGNTLSNFTSGTTALKITDGENKFIATQSGITASVEALPKTTVYASNNSKQVLSDKSATLDDTKPDNEDLDSDNFDTITGYYRWNAFVANSINITATESSWEFVNVKTISSITAADQKYIIVMVPSGYSLTDAKQMGLDFTESFEIKDNVSLTIGGGSDTYNYKMYYWQNTTGSDATVENITIS